MSRIEVSPSPIPRRRSFLRSAVSVLLVPIRLAYSFFYFCISLLLRIYYRYTLSPRYSAFRTLTEPAQCTVSLTPTEVDILKTPATGLASGLRMQAYTSVEVVGAYIKFIKIVRMV